MIANAFNSYYKNVPYELESKLPESNVNFSDFLPIQNPNSINWHNTNENEVRNIITKCKNCKPGLDEIPIILFKKNLDIFCPIITKLCNLSINAGLFPTIHKQGKIIPLYKNKDSTEIKNYRPICLLNSISKILEKMLEISFCQSK